MTAMPNTPKCTDVDILKTAVQDTAKGREVWMQQMCSDYLGGEPESFTTPLVVLASPSWRGVDADIRLAQWGNKRVIVKAWHAETAFYINKERSIVAAQYAGESRVGPMVTHVAPQQDALLMEYLGDEWRTAGLHDLSDPTVRTAVMDAKKVFQHTFQCTSQQHDSRLPSIDSCDQVISLAAQLDALIGQAAHKHSVFYPPRLPVWLEFVATAQAMINALGKDDCLSHREGDVSNIMLNDRGEVRLLDYDSAAVSDRYEDIGIFLFECFDTENGARAGFEEWSGYFNEGEYQRAWLYAVLDDLRWGLIASIMSALSPRSWLEFAKYAAWRFLRAESHLGNDALSRLNIMC